jgi:hypothetical protein
MAKRAKLDHDLVYWGPEDVEALGPDDIAAPDEAIRPGAYRWQPPQGGDVGHWVPLEPKHVRKALTDITSERALYEQLKHQHERDPSLVAPLAVAWAAQYERSWDADNGKLLRYFRAVSQG